MLVIRSKKTFACRVAGPSRSERHGESLREASHTANGFVDCSVSMIYSVAVDLISWSVDEECDTTLVLI
jgi:hypothetical protein